VSSADDQISGRTAEIEPCPPEADRVFGPALPVAKRYVALLAGPGVERGLVGPREPSRLWTRHLLNCAALAEFVPPSAAVLDVGSGAGLPGIPLALARPDLAVTLLEPMARRAAFLEEIVRELGLATVQVRRGRTDDVASGSIGVAVARAVAPLGRLVTMTMPLLRPGGRLIALKGRNAQAEIAAAKSVLISEPRATVTLVHSAAGADVATAVIIDLDPGP
jgi:16S rRNA (guanine527-N7)-methyltransferase